MRKIHFEDHGQDFLTWTLDEHNRVVECEPFQAWLWVGVQVDPDTIKEGERLVFRMGVTYQRLNYATEKIEEGGSHE